MTSESERGDALNPRRYDAKDLARFEARLSDALAKLDELKADAPDSVAVTWRQSSPPMLPEDLLGFDQQLDERREGLKTACARVRLQKEAIANARGLPSKELREMKAELSKAEATVARSEARIEHLVNLIAHGRRNLATDEAQAVQIRAAHAESEVGLHRLYVDAARADLLPDACHEALALLAHHATDRWLAAHFPTDGQRRAELRQGAYTNIRIQLAAKILRPDLEGWEQLIK